MVPGTLQAPRPARPMAPGPAPAISPARLRGLAAAPDRSPEQPVACLPAARQAAVRQTGTPAPPPVTIPRAPKRTPADPAPRARTRTATGRQAPIRATTAPSASPFPTAIKLPAGLARGRTWPAVAAGPFLSKASRSAPGQL